MLSTPKANGFTRNPIFPGVDNIKSTTGLSKPVISNVISSKPEGFKI
jgi:hypothetical protein